MIHKMSSPSEGEHWFEDHALFVRYLISRHTHHRMEVWVSEDIDEQVLPIFSTYRAANEYLRDRELGSGWHVRESTAGELISLLMGHVADVETIVLDLPRDPSLVGDPATYCLSKETFIGSLMKEPMLMAPR